MLEIKHLKTLQALAVHGNLVKTADALFMTQSALSHQIKQLEQSYELTLFERKSNPLVFTPGGKVLLNLADEILPKLQQTERTLKQLASGEQGRLWIGVECHTCFEWLLPLLRQFQNQWPNIDVDLISSLSKSALHGLEQEQLDLVITSDPLQQSELEFHPLFSYEIQLVLPPNHPGRSVAQGGESQQAWWSPEDLQDETLIVYPVAEEKLDVFRQFLNPAQVRPALRQTEMTLMMLHWVESGRGVCALPKWLLDSLTEFAHLPRVRLGPNGIWSTLYAATRRGTSQMPYVQDFIERIQQRMTKSVE
ncbi:LysR substrate-binding domain-containing protein [Thiomicrorhabdus sp. zzn3]|uniref:LysR family transcriptional regulator n=1 Tax=Thiomicrorhabdus sp. zzn3 TaxID=3039775 RepID=UPI00243713A6|nr:LysR family transcriptional regulator [Thiomicrorhabdus sp. zzn3]MDG6778897.1 LysR substrate-binding domain-containing protein [Thiomicrorhabdus sp. zzn3]